MKTFELGIELGCHLLCTEFSSPKICALKPQPAKWWYLEMRPFWSFWVIIRMMWRHEGAVLVEYQRVCTIVHTLLHFFFLPPSIFATLNPHMRTVGEGSYIQSQEKYFPQITMRAPQSLPVASRTVRKCIAVVESTQVIVFCNGSQIRAHLKMNTVDRKWKAMEGMLGEWQTVRYTWGACA